MRRAVAIVITSLSLAAATVTHADVKITPDVVYGHKSGLAMTFDVFTPTENANGAGVLFMVSGGWYSRWRPPEEAQGFFKPLTDTGFTVFAVRHGSSPKFSIPEAVTDVRRGVRYIRLNADKFMVDPKRLGVYGMSAGGHLSLMLGTASDDGEEGTQDPVLRVSDRVQAVVAIVAPTDLRIMVWDAPDALPAYKGYPALNLDLKAAEQNSPLVHVSPDDPPTLMIAGDQDKLVPVAHSRNIHATFDEKKVVNKLVEIEGAGHGFQGDDFKRATTEMVAWFEEHLRTK
ncbi:MAG: peptidase S9 [Planctomycetaceae bacterium]|nr:peptidase S9 [Planctomycetaceae bacterium]